MPDPSAQPATAPPAGIPGLIRLLTLIVSVAVLASAVLGALLAVALPAFVEGQRVALGLLGFEIVTVVAGALGILTARGRFDHSPGMALVCIGGTILLSSALGWQAAGRQLGGVSLLPFLGLRVLAALGLMAAAGFCVLRLEPRSWKPAIAGGLLGLPLPVLGAAMLHGPTRRMLESAATEHGILMTLAAVAGIVAVCGMLAASVQLIIGAFERAADSRMRKQ